MLFDPKWKETKADPFAIATLIAWLETMPADQEYCFEDRGGCLYAQYFEAHGFTEVQCGGWSIAYGAHPDRKRFRLPDEWLMLPVSHPRTFGAALGRARKLEA